VPHAQPVKPANLEQSNNSQESMVRQTALETQDLPRAYLAHHELESKFIITITIMMVLCCRPQEFR